MIIRLSSDIPTFREVTFKAGFNVVLADKTESSTDKDTTNGAGKSLLLDLIDFCLGATYRDTRRFARPELAGFTFSLDLLLGGAKVTASRKTDAYDHVLVTILDDDHRRRVFPDALLPEQSIGIDQWRELLGKMQFGLSPSSGKAHGLPSYRQLLSFFIRTGQEAYSDPFKTHPNSSLGQIAILNCYLLNLNWEFASRYELLRKKREELSSLKKGVQIDKALGKPVSKGSLEADLQRMSREHAQRQSEIATFRVLEEYQSIQGEANRLTRDLQKQRDELAADKELLSLYQSSLSEEQDVDPELVREVFEGAGALLADSTVEQLDRVREFHNEVVRNRKAFLHSETRRLQQLITDRESVVRKLDSQRAQCLSLLKGSGALDDYYKMQHSIQYLQGRIDDVKRQIQRIEEIQRLERDTKRDSITLDELAAIDWDERSEIRKEASGLFNEISSALYDESGKLVLDSDGGYRFKIEMRRDASDGIGRMKVFCYDLMLARLWSMKRQSPGFLLHDNLILDGVDVRQRGHSLEQAYYSCQEAGFQYVILLNRDQVPPDDLLGGLSIDDHVRIVLTDQVDGCLLGFRY